MCDGCEPSVGAGDFFFIILRQRTKTGFNDVEDL